MCVCNLLQFDSAFGYYWEKYMKIIWDLIRAHMSEAVNSARTDPGSYPYEKQLSSLSGVYAKRNKVTQEITKHCYKQSSSLTFYQVNYSLTILLKIFGGIPIPDSTEKKSSGEYFEQVLELFQERRLEIFLHGSFPAINSRTISAGICDFFRITIEIP